MSEKESNKNSAITFLQLTASGNIDEAFSQYVGPTFKHHNHYFKGDKESLMAAMKESSIKMPNKVFEVKIAMEEEDKVMAYSHVKTAELDIAVVHIMKFKNERIVEMWDLGQLISKDSPNENGMF